MNKIKHIKKPYPINLYMTLIDNSDILKGITRIATNVEVTIESAIDTLTEREGDCIHLWFKDRMTQAEIGEIFGVCGARIGAILDNAVRKLAHPKRLYIIFNDDISATDYLKENENQYIDKDIDIAALSTNTINYLKGEYVYTIRDLLNLDRHDIEFIVGCRRLAEIDIKLMLLGLRLKRIKDISDSDNIVRLNMNKYYRMCLRKSGINTIGALRACSYDHIRDLPGIGDQGSTIIYKSLMDVGLSFNNMSDEWTSTLSKDAPIAVLDLSVRSYSALVRSGIYSIGILANTTCNQLSSIPNIGSISLNEIRETLKKYGIQLKEDA